MRLLITLFLLVNILYAKKDFYYGFIDSSGSQISEQRKQAISDGFDILQNARNLAREKGANIVKVTEKKEPSILGSSCYRIKVDFYFYEGDVTKLSQYQLQIN